MTFFTVVVLLLLIVMVFCLTEFALAVQYIQAKRKGWGKIGPISNEAMDSSRELPMVTIQLPIFNEIYVVERVIRSAAAVDYPRDRLQIQVLDDSTDQTVDLTRSIVEELRTEGLDILLLHREVRDGYKAGALRDAMPSCKGEFIAIFDADFIVPEDFLKTTLPCFSDALIGMVQTRWGHLNEQFSLLTRIQGFFIDLHFSVQHTGRNSAGCFINFNGTAGIWRRACIEDSGGWTPDTLTEDLDLSYRAQLRGWKFKYQEGISAPAELPAHMNGIKSQQFRWIKGGAQVGRKIFLHLLRSNATIRQKWFGFMHIFSGCTYLFSFALFLLSVPLVYLFRHTFLYDLLPYMAIFLVSTFAMIFAGAVSFFHVKHDVNFRAATFCWRFLLFLSFTMGLSLNNTMATIEGLSGRDSAFVRTPKFSLTASSSRHSWAGLSYLGHGKHLQVIAEIFLLGYFCFGILLAFLHGFFGLIALHLMLVAGYALIVYFTIKHGIAAHA